MTLNAVRLDDCRRRLRRSLRVLAGASLLSLTIAGCQVSELAHGDAAHLAPLPASLKGKIGRLNMDERSPILLRIYKEEDQLEVWKRDRSGNYKMLKEYDICAWSGKLGPKFKEGDRQAPEGFYTVTPGRMNPNSSYHLSFNIGFPNAYDRANGRTGSNLMVHGDCSSRGCYAMEDQQIQEIYALAREAFRGGQQGFQIQALPFRMTPENMARHADSEHLEFWEMLKVGTDHFEVSGKAPKIDVCGRRYVFNATPSGGSFSSTSACPTYEVSPQLKQLVAAKQASDLEKRNVLVAKAKIKEERQKNFEARDEAIAALFKRERNDTTAEDVSDAAVASADPSVLVGGGTPFPKPSPIRRASTSAASQDKGIGFRIPSLFGNGDKDDAPAAVAATTPPAASANAPVASTAGVISTPPPGVPASPETPEVAVAPQPAAPPQPLGYASEEEKEGFFSSITKGSRSLFDRAGSLFD
ncbi:murein L,D-transpeptidase family protein [Acuticoccus sp. MNP-M23]|uniref:murein L,D-transpeptidase family protein n=1 Tax=Acuticoccus sp. MNP-M23 TaxID=3072793 RepID=UPI0028156C13|nr:murein L,D-transpeptidase family protein [Acuticoccus sp. MNP-M23]WMS41602.1 murein L,D-transpeptidase family protein [Acuticoccus sp. MNP-M23]